MSGSCGACSHPARGSIDPLLRSGKSPRTLAKSLPDLTRQQLTRHRDRCLQIEANGTDRAASNRRVLRILFRGERPAEWEDSFGDGADDVADALEVLDIERGAAA